MLNLNEVEVRKLKQSRPRPPALVTVKAETGRNAMPGYGYLEVK